MLTERTPKGLWPIGTILEKREGKDSLARKFQIGLGNRVDLVRNASYLAPIKIDKALNDLRLTFSPNPFRTGWLERSKLRAIEDRRTRALDLLTSKTRYEEAKRLYFLHTGKKPQWSASKRPQEKRGPECYQRNHQLDGNLRTQKGRPFLQCLEIKRKRETITKMQLTPWRVPCAKRLCQNTYQPPGTAVTLSRDLLS